MALATKPLAVGGWSGLALLTASAVDSVATGSLSSETALDWCTQNGICTEVPPCLPDGSPWLELT